MKVCGLIPVLSLVVLTAGKFAVALECKDNERFKLGKLTCKGVAEKQYLCKKMPVKKNCKKSCGLCADGPTPGPTVSSPTVCQDDDEFKFKAGKRFYGCKDIEGRKKKKMCSFKYRGQEVKAKCPVACDLCVGPTNAPTSSSPPTSCEDDGEFEFKARRKFYECKDIEGKKKRKMCRINYKGQEVKSKCPVACDLCAGPTAAPTTPAPTICEDDPDFTFGRKKKYQCEDIKSKNLEKACPKKDKKGIKIETRCKVSCGLCSPVPTFAPSTSPTSEPSTNPTNVQ